MLVKGADKLADIFGTTRQTIVAWQGAGMPVAKIAGRGRPNDYDTRACIEWRVAQAVEKVRDESPLDRLNRVKAESVEMDNAVKRGELIKAKDIEPRMRAAVISAREHLLAVPARITDDPKLRERWAKEVEAFLHRISNWPLTQQVEEAELEAVEGAEES